MGKGVILSCEKYAQEALLGFIFAYQFLLLFQNIFLSSNGKVAKLGDFGIARQLNE